MKVSGLAVRAASDPATACTLADALRTTTAEPERWRFRPGQLVIVDEASLAATMGLDRIAASAAGAGAKLLLVGDCAQLSSVDAGGAFGLLVRDRGTSAPELGAARRFTHQWERHASSGLRLGHPAPSTPTPTTAASTTATRRCSGSRSAR